MASATTTRLKLIALVLGEGSVVSLVLDADESVGELKKLLCREQQYTFPASGLTLFAARATTAAAGSASASSSSSWLRADDPLVRALKKGAVPSAELLDEDLEMDPTYPLSDYFSGPDAPQLKQIHVLVQLPATANAPSPAVSTAVSSATTMALAPPTLMTPVRMASPHLSMTSPPVAPPCFVPASAPMQSSASVPMSVAASNVTPTQAPRSVASTSMLRVRSTPATIATAAASRATTGAPATTLERSPRKALARPPAISSSAKPTTAAAVSSSDIAQPKRTTTERLPRTAAVTTTVNVAAGADATDKAPRRQRKTREASNATAQQAPPRSADATTNKSSSSKSEEVERKRNSTRSSVPPPVDQALLTTRPSVSMPPASSLSRTEPRRLQTTTWAYRASAMFFYLHPALGACDLTRTTAAFAIVPGTFRNWLTKRAFFTKWVPRVQSLTLHDAVAHMPAAAAAQCAALVEQQPLMRVDVPERFVTAVAKQHELESGGSELTGDKRQRTELQMWSIESHRVGAAKKKQRLQSDARLAADAAMNAKTIGSGRPPKYQVHEAFMMRHVRLAWETGAPLATTQIYALLRREFSPRSVDSQDDGDKGDGNERAVSEFVTRMGLALDHVAAPLSQWVARRLEANDWTVHLRRAEPRIPANWHDAARQTALELRELMLDVDVLVSADELFVRFHAAVATAKTADASDCTTDESEVMTGCTVVLGCELFSSTLLPPFTIIAGVGDRNNDTVSSDNSSSSREDKDDSAASLPATYDPQHAAATPSHWMDAAAAKQYVTRLAALFPGKQIGLIWDTASSHVDASVLAHIEALNIVVGFVPPGLGGAMHVCNRVFGRERLVQHAVHEQFVRWKAEMSSDETPSVGPCCIEPSRVLAWVETAVAQTQRVLQDDALAVQRAFQALGLDPRVGHDADCAFVAHLDGLTDETVAQLLRETQCALVLE